MWNRYAALFVLSFAPLMGAQQPAIATGQADGQQMSVGVEGGLVSVRLQNASIRAVSEEIARRAAIKINFAKEIEDSDISLAFNGAAVDLGLRALLANYDVFFYYGGAGEAPPSLRAIWVFPKGAALPIQPVSIAACAGGKEIEAVLAEPDSRARQAAYEALMTRPDSRSRDLVIQALRGTRERDDDLRQRLFSTALSRGFEIPQDALAELARSDRSEQVRWMALDALSQQPMAKQAAEAALTDASPVVRQKAEEIITAVNAENLRQTGVSRPPDQQP